MIKYDLENDFELEGNDVVAPVIDDDKYFGNWLLERDDMEQLATNELGNELNGLNDEDRSDLIYEEIYENMLQIGRISKTSLLGKTLKAYNDDPETAFKLSNMRSMVELPDAYYTVHGVSYDIFNQDILKGKSFEFYKWLQKEQNKVELTVSFM